MRYGSTFGQVAFRHPAGPGLRPTMVGVTGTGPKGWQPLRRPVRPSGPLVATPFGRLAVPHALNSAGDALVTIALAGSLFFSISPSEARGKVALSLVLTMAPFALVAPFLGPAIDASRRGRRAMVVISCLGRAVCCLLMARVIDNLLLFPAAFTTLVLSKGYTVSKSALVPSVVDSEHGLVEANARLSIVAAVAGFVAALPGVALLRFFDAEWVLQVAAVAFLAGAITAVKIVETRRREPRREAAGDAEVRSAGIVAAAVAMAVLRALTGFMTFLVAFAFRRSDAPDWWFGLVLAASVAAGLIGAFVAPRLRGLVREERILAGCLFLTAVGGFSLARLDGRLWSAAMAAVVGLTSTVGKLAFDALVQRDAPDAVRGRSFARFEAGFQFVWVVGALLPVLVPTPLRQGFDVIAISGLTAGVAFVAAGRALARSRRSHRQLGTGAPVPAGPPARPVIDEPRARP